MRIENHRTFFTACLVGAGLGVGPPSQAPADSLPAGVSQAMVDAGRGYFLGPGLCSTCHGQDGKGGLGPNLTDRAWLHGKGSFPELVSRVMTGVGPDSSKSGQVMPPRGGSGLTAEQVRSVAAYVWTLSHGPRPR